MTAFVAKDVPEPWRVGLFGGTASCEGPPTKCRTLYSNRDVDLLIIYPDGEARAALRARQKLRADFAGLSLTTDIVLLSVTEAESSGFWHREHVRVVRECVSTEELKCSSAVTSGAEIETLTPEVSSQTCLFFLQWLKF